MCQKFKEHQKDKKKKKIKELKHKQNMFEVLFQVTGTVFPIFIYKKVTNTQSKNNLYNDLHAFGANQVGNMTTHMLKGWLAVVMLLH